MTYDEVGASLDALPSGYRHARYETRLAREVEVFDEVRERIRHWAGHRAAGISLAPARPALEEGTTIAQLLRLGPLYEIACCRIVRVVDDLDRFGFAYGTLPIHPEQGEEAFLVSRTDEDVKIEITAFSRPAGVLTRLGGPLTRLVQDAVSRRYLDGLCGR